jgi:hypothetical protein
MRRKLLGFVHVFQSTGFISTLSQNMRDSLMQTSLLQLTRRENLKRTYCVGIHSQFVVANPPAQQIMMYSRVDATE